MGISGRGLIDSDTATPEQSAELVGWPPRQRCMRAVLTGWLLGLVMIGCASPVPIPSMATTPVTSETSSPPAAEPRLRVESVATALGFSELRTAPGAGKEAPGNVEAGSMLYITAGPDRREGVDWWLVQADLGFAFGWMPSMKNGMPTLVAIDPACPPVAGTTVDQVIGMGRIRGLACFGDAQLTFDANVMCLGGAFDGGAGGASWMDSNRACRTVGDPAIALYGEPVTSTLGADLAAGPRTARFRVTGHFDDPEARGCWNVPVGVSLDSRGQPEPDAVIACRERFVVTEAVRLE
jgi:hypothetical protein